MVSSFCYIDKGYFQCRVSDLCMAGIDVDMQNCFVHGYPVSAPDGLELRERINRSVAPE